MKNINLKQLFLAVATVLSLGGVGVSLALNSVAGIIACLILTVIFVGTGFKIKAKLHKKGLL